MMWNYGADALKGYDYASMMGWGGSYFWALHVIIWVVVIIDLILLGMWLWKQINKK